MLAGRSGENVRAGFRQAVRTITCRHLKALFDLCQAHGLRLSSSDLIRIMCHECGTEEACPSVLYDEYDAKHSPPVGGDESSGGAEKGTPPGEQSGP